MAEKVIGDTTYRVNKLKASEALHLLGRITKVAGAAIERLPTIFKGVGQDGTPEANASNAAAIAAFSDIFMKNNTDELVSLVKDIVQSAEIRRPSGSYEPVDFDGDMSDRMEQIVPLGMFILQERFASFFGGAQAAGVRKAAKG